MASSCVTDVLAFQCEEARRTFWFWEIVFFVFLCLVLRITPLPIRNCLSVLGISSVLGFRHPEREQWSNIFIFTRTIWRKLTNILILFSAHVGSFIELF